ncbi:hypothetical protein [Burkholderia contaminans]|nr:hypothetical protein [Burkholderia contaminans]
MDLHPTVRGTVDAQIRWIERALGIKAPRRIDGTPLIRWEQINNVL